MTEKGDRPDGDERDASPPELRLECAVCGRAFPSGLVRDRRPSEGVDPPVRVHECPFCGFTTAYGAADYR